MEAFDSAKQILYDEKIESDFNIKERIEKMQECFKSVKKYNIVLAKKLLSEGILDLLYIENPKTNVKSFRISHEEDTKKRLEEIDSESR